MTEPKKKPSKSWIAILAVAALFGLAGYFFGPQVFGERRGDPVEPTGEPVTDIEQVRMGDYVQIESDGEWYDGVVRRVQPDGRVLVHYDGWDSRYDEAVGVDRLRER